MMRLGRPEHPASKKKREHHEETTTEDTQREKEASEGTSLLDLFKMLWSNKKEDHDRKTKE